MTLSSLLLGTSCLYYIANSDCKWQANWEGGTKELDFSCVANEEITLNEGPSTTFPFSLCGDRVSCPGNPEWGNIMVKQVVVPDDGSDDLCYYIGKWDADVVPDYNGDNDGSWHFTYQGNSDCGPEGFRLWEPTFICDSSVNGFDADPVEEPGNNCRYTVNIRTKYACEDGCAGGGPSSGSSGDEELSAGWIFIICLGGGFLLYCLGGYLFMGLTVNKEQGLGAFNDNIPNRSFWVACPKLVMAGCQVSFEFVKGLMNKNGGDGEELAEPITDTADTEQ